MNHLIISVMSTEADNAPRHTLWIGGAVQAASYVPAPGPRDHYLLDPATLTLIADLRNSVAQVVLSLHGASSAATTDPHAIADCVMCLQDAYHGACCIYAACLGSGTLTWDWGSVAQDLELAADAVRHGRTDKALRALRPLLQRLRQL